MKQFDWRVAMKESLVVPYLALSVVVVGALLGACAAPEPVEEAAPEPAEAAPVQIDAYTVRGEVVELPDPADPRPQISLHHEAIDDLKGTDGTIWGMDSMTMSFDVTETVALEGIAAGDKVEFVLEVDWNADPPSWVSQVRQLPPDTELEFHEARPPADE
jgi:Cu/Ag efflux protein CusF